MFVLEIPRLSQKFADSSSLRGHFALRIDKTRFGQPWVDSGAGCFRDVAIALGAVTGAGSRLPKPVRNKGTKYAQRR